jgi:hypothetical protein
MPNPRLVHTEFVALQDLYNSLRGAEWVWNNITGKSVPWNFSIPDADPCFDNWQGLTCTCNILNCKIQVIELERHNVAGELPLSVGSFPELLLLSFRGNKLIGTIPETIGNLTKLETLDISYNHLVREIPKTVNRMAALQLFVVSGNNLTRIPDELFSLTQLRVLDLSLNQFNGPFPEGIANLTSLQVLQLQHNAFTQALPNIFGSMTSLKAIDVSNNVFWGPFPTSLCLLKNLTNLLASICFLNSTVYPCITNLTNLIEFDISKNFLYGKLPGNIGDLVHVRTFSVSYNYLSGELPRSLGQIHNLEQFFVQSNSFSGPIDWLFKNLTRAQSIYIADNFFTGSIEEVASTRVANIDVSNNLLTGRMPWNYTWTKLAIYENYLNYFTGPLSYSNTSVVSNQSCLFTIYVLVASNYLTGSIPDYYFTNCVSLYFFDLSANLFTGTLSKNISELHNLNQFNISSNFMVGTLPKEIIALGRVSVLDFSYNQFIGTVPAEFQFMHSVVEFFVQSNQFTGAMYAFLGGDNDPTDHSKKATWGLANLDISSNRFTGTIPANFFGNRTLSLKSFAASSNCLSGSIPDTICTLTQLQSLSLDGLSTAENCRVPLFSAVSPYFNAFMVRYFIQGTIPSCLFELTTLQLLHLSGNGITGSISNNASLSNSLVDLSLSHNLLTGTIPNSIQTKYWENLDLSYNKLTGTLSSQFAGVFDPSGNQQLYLEINRLSGDIPSSFQNITNLAVLNGNIFSCSFKGGNLPQHDSDYADYSCGSDSVNSVLVLWVFIVLLLTPILGVLYLKCFRVKIRDENKRNQIATVVDNGETNTTSNLNQLWSQVQVWKSALRPPSPFYSEEEESKQSEDKRRLTNLFRLSLFLNEIRNSILILTGYCIFILVPLYCILKVFNASYSVEYAWYVAGVLLSGEIAAILLFLAVLGFVVLMYYLINQRMTRKVNEQAPQASSVAQNSITTEGNGKEEASEKRELFIMAFIYTIIFLIDLVVMGIVDFSYVYIVINYGTVVVTLTAFSLAIFRLITNNLLLWTAIPQTISLVTYCVPSWKELSFYLIKHPKSDFNSSNVASFSSYYTARDISFLENVILFNNIVIPVLAIAFILPDCFYNALFAADSVSSYYNFERCDQYIYLIQQGRICSEETETLSYSPPFIYSYQCSSKIIINYVSVYILMFILIGFIIPPTKLLIKWWYKSLTRKMESSSSLAPSPSQLKLKSFLEAFLPMYFHPLQEFHPSENDPLGGSSETRTLSEQQRQSQEESGGSRSMFTRLTMIFQRPDSTNNATGKKSPSPSQLLFFSKLNLTVQINSYLTILATFGALFPPLAIIACMTIFIITYFEELSIGWLLTETRARKYFWYEEQLNHEAENVEKSSNFTLWSTLTVSCFFYGYIVFDTMGDTAGWKAALPMTVLLLFFPLLLYLFVSYWKKYCCTSVKKRKEEQGTTIQHNPILRESSVDLTFKETEMQSFSSSSRPSMVDQKLVNVI